jgi:3-dehydroquinate dehydratase/shikimate dehydrogenase
MNNGKICVSVCAETADEFSKNIKLAKPLADFIELRFDCLKEDEIENVKYDYDENYIFTFRPKEQGGKRELTLQEREDFWNSGNDFCGADFEEDVVENHLYWLYKPVICSYHDFDRIPDNLPQIYERIKFAEANIDVIKIAVHTNDITDTIPIWKLLEKAIFENQQIIPIAMGEAGKWTRILGLAHGAFMTYASLDSGRETAPGQVSARDLREVYRAKELDENTEVYGILGSNTSVSMSPYIHNAAFKYHNLNSVFVPLQVHNLDEFITRMVKPETREIELNFKGFSVTIPHKQAIIKHLDFLDETAKKIGAVNTVKIVDGKLHGYNTDAHGFVEPLLNSYGDLTGSRVAVLGAGGAARACVYALQQSGAKATIFARNVEKARSFADEFEAELKELVTGGSTLVDYKDFDILVNTTPLGMKGKAEGETPATVEQLKGLHLVYDLVYIPFQTPLMSEADAAEVPKIGGLAMLIAQAMEQQKIWTGLDAPMREMSRAALERLQ